MSTTRKPGAMVDHGKRKKTIVVVLEVPDEKSLEEIEEELKLFGCEIKSVQETVFRVHKKGGDCNDNRKKIFCRTGRAGGKRLLL